MRIVGILLIMLISFSCDTENSFPIPQENYFVKFYGEEGDQEGVDFIVNTDGSVVMVGNTVRPGVEQQIYVVKVDANGQVLWQRRIGLPDKKDIAKDIELHPDGRIVIAGETAMGTGNRDVYIRTLSQDGSLLDSARVPASSIVLDTDEEVNSVSIITNGFIVAGGTTLLESGAPSPNDLRDALHLRFDNSLGLIDESLGTWSNVTGTSNSDDYAVKVIEVDPNILYYVFGSSNEDKGDNTADYDFWLFGLGSTGGPYPGPGPAPFDGEPLFYGDSSEDDFLMSVEISPDQSGPGYLLNGISKRATGFTQSSIVKITKAISLGRISKTAETKPTAIGDNVSSMVRTVGQIDETFLTISNDYNLPNSGSSISLLKLNRELSNVWPVPLIFGGEGDDFSGSVSELPNGRILISGTMTIGGGNDKGQKKMVLIKLNSEGKLTE